MQKTLNLFKKMLPIIISLTMGAFFFGLLSFIYYYNNATMSVNFKSIISIIYIIFTACAYGTAIAFSVKAKHIHIRKIKRTNNFFKFSSLLAAIMATALFLFDFFRFVTVESLSSSWRLVRLIFFIPLICHIVIGLIPKKYKRHTIVVPKWLKIASSVGSVLWSIFGLLTIYFWNALPTTNFFKLMHVFFYLFAILFFLFEAKFELLKPNHRLYIFFSLALFIHSVTFVGTTMFAKLFGSLSKVALSEFELVCALCIGIYALSRVYSIAVTLRHIKENSDDIHHSRKFDAPKGEESK